jgi:hypothetical protein
MNIKICIVILILLSFFNIGAFSNKISNNSNSFSTLEKEIKYVSEFEENGVKLQYKTKDSVEKELSRVKKYLTDNLDDISNGEIGRNEFQAFNKDFNINVKLWAEDSYSYVEITLSNKNAQYTAIDLKNILQKLEIQGLKNIQYFLYYEGKEELDCRYIIDKLSKDSGIQGMKLLEISNGYTGTGYLSNGDKTNFALIKYNTSSHIIIGTPIIFTTY